MTFIGYFTSNSVFVPAVLLRAVDFQSPPQRKHIETKMKNSVSKGRPIRFVRIFAGIPRQVMAPSDSGVLESGDAKTFSSNFPAKSPRLCSNAQSLVGFSVIPKCVTFNDL